MGQFFQKLEKLPFSKDVSPFSYVNDITSNGASTSVNILMECSNGSERLGRKMGKEHWQHTKKCLGDSQRFTILKMI